MKRSKFGAFDIILAVLIVAGLGLNAYAYGFFDKDTASGELETSRRPSSSASSQTDENDSPASGSTAGDKGDGGGQGSSAPTDNETEKPDETPTPSSSPSPTPTTTPSPAPPTTTAPQETVINSLVFRLGNPNVAVNGQEAAIDELGSAPFNHEGASVLPLRAVYEIIGGELEYDAATRYMTATFLGTSLKVKTGETGAEINGMFATLSVAPVNSNGTAYVPARAIADALGAELIWDGATQSITLEIPSLSVVPPSSLLPPVSEAPVDHTPSGAPTAADFTWFMSGARPAVVPRDATQITDLDEIMGDWKMLIWIDPDHIVEYESAYILAMVNINEVGGTVSMSIDQLLMVDEDGTTQDMSRFGVEVYTGGYLPTEMGIFTGNEGCMFTVTDFYVKDGRQYGIGNQEVQSGEPCYIALVRP